MKPLDFDKVDVRKWERRYSKKFRRTMKARCATIRRREIEKILVGLSCVHSRMRYCCPKPCGHLVCPDCGLAWDQGANK